MIGILLWSIWIGMRKKYFKIMELSNEYVQGFNNGYIIRKNHPLLMKTLTKGIKENSEYVEGLKAGGSQYESEMKLMMSKFKQVRITAHKKKKPGLEF